MEEPSKYDLLEKRKEQILEEVSINDLLTALRVDYNTGRKIHCIFPTHQEKTPSMVVYEKTNSVYCFGCGESGDVIRLVQVCVPTSGKVWPLERAISWLEDEFDLAPPKALDSLSIKIGKALESGKTKKVEKAATLARKQALNLIDATFDELQEEHSLQARGALSSLEDYIYDVLDRPGLDVLEWSVWALKLAKGSYTKGLAAFDEWIDSEEFQNAAREIEEDEDLVRETHLDWDERVG